MFPLFLGGGSFYKYQIRHSALFIEEDSCYMTRVVGAPTDVDKWSFSTWLKFGDLEYTISTRFLLSEYTDAQNEERIDFSSTDHHISFSQEVGGVINTNISTDGFYRDPAAWYHFLFVYDSKLSTATDRFKFFVNGVEVDRTNTNNVNSNQNSIINTSGKTLWLGTRDTSGLYTDMYLAETIFVDGQALSPTDFGRSQENIWVPIRYTGTYGNNGFHLDYADNANLGNDISGNNNDWTEFGFTTANQFVDTPTDSFVTMNQLDLSDTDFVPALLTDGNRKYTQDAAPNTNIYSQTRNVKEKYGKWYCEFYAENIVTTLSYHVAFMGASYRASGEYIVSGGAWTAGLSSYTSGDYVGIAVDMENDLAYFYKNGVLQGSSPYSHIVDTSAVVHRFFGSNVNDTFVLNNGGNGFQYDGPAGFKTWSTKNYREPRKYFPSSKGFDVILYTGTGAEHSITGMDFQPDLVWIKDRNQATIHSINDSVRGSTIYLNASDVAVENTNAQSVKSFDPGGFTLGTGGSWNGLGQDFVAYCWKKDPDYGFDIVAFTGNHSGGAPNNQDVAHNLGAIPEMMILKNRDRAVDWVVYHQSLTDSPTYYVSINTTAAEINDTTVWNSTVPTDSVFSVGQSLYTNGSGEDIIAYLFRSIPGFSRVFSYTGTGNANGPFLDLGFKPKYVILKNYTDVASWLIYDIERDPYNIMNTFLLSNSSAAEGVAAYLDFISNGIKIRAASNSVNGSGDRIIGIAFAENPLKYTNAQ